MCRLIMVFGFFVFFPSIAFAYNESVAAISFNPSRLGAYTHLKAVNTATLRGGLSVGADQLYINSKGTITLFDENHKCQSGSGNCAADKLNKINTIKPLSTVTGACASNPKACTGNTSANTSAIMQGIDAVGSGGPVDNSHSVMSNDPFPTNFDVSKSTKVYMKGGTFVATGDSYIGSFEKNDGLKTLKVTASQLNIVGDLDVKNSMKLGSITIQGPEIPNAPAWKSYEFVERVTKDKKKVKVLAVKK